jgi:hypothetical protein
MTEPNNPLRLRASRLDGGAPTHYPSSPLTKERKVNVTAPTRQRKREKRETATLTIGRVLPSLAHGINSVRMNIYFLPMQVMCKMEKVCLFVLIILYSLYLEYDRP